jgi:type I restriction enzyme, S subunit
MNRYDSFKDSGVEWIGEIPSHWKFGPMKYVLSNNDGGVWGKDVEVEGEGVYVIRSTEITIDGNWNFSNPMKRILDNKEIEKSRLISGDIVITKSSGSPNHIGKSVIVSEEIENLICCYSNFVQRIRFKNYSPKLYHYILNSFIVREQYRFLTQTTTGLGNLSGTTLNEVYLPFIPLSEQQQIVSFLDDKTQKIDTLIQQKEKKIELLKEKRISLINHVVTKGFDSNVEMKDSGVEWIGEIPSHWDFVKVGHYSNVVRGGSPRPSGDPRFFNGDFIHWITVKDITSKKGKYVTDTLSKLTKEGMKQSRVLKPETLVLTNSGVTLGVPGILKIQGCINDGSVGFLDLSEKLERDYLYYFWTTQTELLLEQQSGYGQPNLNIDIVSNVKFPLPSKNKQQQIVEYLDKQTEEIDTLIQLEQKKIDTLKEYRQSLISEVVTGKIKICKEDNSLSLNSPIV